MSTTTLTAAAPPPSDPLTAALTAAGRGWHVFPLHPDSKRPAVRDWEGRATTDPDRIQRCWSAGSYGVGVACGPSGLVVVDLDTTAADAATRPEEWDMLGISDGLDVFTVLASKAGASWPATYTVRTPSGGLHLYFTAPARLGLRNTQGRLGWKIDTRAAGGYVVAAGSTVIGLPYVVVDDQAPVVLPRWLANPLRPPAPPPPATLTPTATAARGDAYVAAAIRGETQRVQTAPRGQHNHSLYIAACALGQLVAGGQLTRADATVALQHAAAGHIASRCGCTAREVDATIASGLRAGHNRPRRPGAAA